MLQRIAITFRCRRKQIFRVILERYIKRVECSQRSGFESFDSMNGVVHRTRRAGEVKYVIDSSAIERLVDVKLAKFKPAFVAQMLEIGLPAGQQVINGDNRVTFTQKRITQMGAEESRSAGDQGTWLAHHRLSFLAGVAAAAF